FSSAFNTVIPGQADTEAQPGTALIAVPLDQGLPHQQASGVTVLSIHSTNTIIKFADDTTIVGLISDNDEDPLQRGDSSNLTQWCSNNNLVMNTSKTKEVVVDYRRYRREHASLLIHASLLT
ncbi:hypothetical protein L3Q82_015710, partial [Scortum barcoo]